MVDYVERLEKLGEVVKAVPPKLFDMDVWKFKETCGTVGCAAGHAASHPWFKRRGLKINSFSNPEYRGRIAYEALADFFGLSKDDAHALFFSGGYSVYAGAPAKREFLGNLRKVIREKQSALDRARALQQGRA